MVSHLQNFNALFRRAIQLSLLFYRLGLQRFGSLSFEDAVKLSRHRVEMWGLVRQLIDKRLEGAKLNLIAEALEANLSPIELENFANELQAERISGDVAEIFIRIAGIGPDALAAMGELRGLMRAICRGYERVEAIMPPRGKGVPQGVLSPEAKIFKAGKEFRLEVKTATKPPNYNNWRTHFDKANKANKQIKASGYQGEIYFDFTLVDIIQGKRLTGQAEIERLVANKMQQNRARSIIYFEIRWRSPDGTLKTTFRSRANDGTLSAITTERHRR